MVKRERLRFAPLIRVSTEEQAKRKESLLIQTEAIKQYVAFLGGTIPEHCWVYCGQEHATPEYERAKLDLLLKDCARDKFDAVIVYDASRWSRDTYKHEEALRILRKNKIRFFVGTIEQDLFDPTQEVILNTQVNFAQYQAKLQKLKSITSRINRAKRGMPATGKLPYGRIFNQKTGEWSIDKAKQKKIRWAAERYLAGDSIPRIASTLGMNAASLWKTLNHRSGTKWLTRFEVKELNINETVTLTVPPLLDEKTIAAIHEQARANKTYNHGEIKYRYLLSRMIFCAKCGYTMFGQMNHGTKRYYRHARHRKKDCRLQKFLPADLIENSVLIHLVRTLGDVERLRKAVEKATPNAAKIEELLHEQTQLKRETKKVTAQKERIVDAVAEGTLSSDEVKSKMEKLRTREEALLQRATTIEAQLENAPDPAKVKKLSQLGLQVLKAATKAHPEDIFTKPYEWKRKLVEHAFGGKDTKRERLGVYIEETGDPKQPWKFEIRGVLEKTLLGLPLDDEYLEDAFRLDPEYQDMQARLKEIRSAITNFNYITRCTSRHRCLSTMPSRACITTSRCGWRSLRRMSL